jgi:hypothetical protein
VIFVLLDVIYSQLSYSLGTKGLFEITFRRPKNTLILKNSV